MFKKLLIMSTVLLSLIIGNMAMADAMKPTQENPALLNHIKNHKHDYVYQMNSYAGPGRFNITDIKSIQIEWSNDNETVIRVKTIACGIPGGGKVYLEELGYTRYAYNHVQHNMYEEVKDEKTGAANWKYLPPTKGGNYRDDWVRESASASAEQVYYIATGKKFHVNSPYNYDYSEGVTKMF